MCTEYKVNGEREKKREKQVNLWRDKTKRPTKGSKDSLNQSIHTCILCFYVSGGEITILQASNCVFLACLSSLFNHRLPIVCTLLFHPKSCLFTWQRHFALFTFLSVNSSLSFSLPLSCNQKVTTCDQCTPVKSPGHREKNRREKRKKKVKPTHPALEWFQFQPPREHVCSWTGTLLVTCFSFKRKWVFNCTLNDTWSAFSLSRFRKQCMCLNLSSSFSSKWKVPGAMEERRVKKKLLIITETGNAR